MGALMVTLHPGGWLGGGEREGQGCRFLVGPFWGCRPLDLKPTPHPTSSTLSPPASRETPKVGVASHPAPQPCIPRS